MAEVGASYRTSVQVADAAGSVTEPDSAVLTVTLPDQTLESPDVTWDEDGQFNYVDYQFTQEGLYRFVWATTNPTTVKTNFLPVSDFRSVVSIDDVKTFIAYDSDVNKDDLLRQVMVTATELIEEVVGICVIRTFVNERVPGSLTRVIQLPRAPLPDESAVTSIQSVYSDGPSWTTDELICHPDSGTVEIADMQPFYYGPWKATFSAGRRIISRKIQQSAMEICYDLWSTQRAYGMDALEPGPEDTAKWEMMLNTYKIPPHAALLLSGEALPGFR